jgi:hypothetical protein
VVKEWSVGDIRIPRRLGPPLDNALRVQLVLTNGSRGTVNVHAECLDDIDLWDVWQRVLTTNWREVSDDTYRGIAGLEPIVAPPALVTSTRQQFDGLVPVGLLSSRPWSEIR